MKKRNLCWIRRDLRLSDHHALYACLNDAKKNGKEVMIHFNFDPQILTKLPTNDRRLTFIVESLLEIREILSKQQSELIISHGDPVACLEDLVARYQIDRVFFNRDYEPYAKERDEKVIKKLAALNVEALTFKDSVVFEKHEVTTDKGEVYKVFTPYKNKWLQKFSEQFEKCEHYPTTLHSLLKKEDIAENDLIQSESQLFLKLGFVKTDNVLKGGRSEALKRFNDFKTIMEDYKRGRDYWQEDKTSFLSPYIRMGNLSIREMMNATLDPDQNNEGAKTWQSELIWREFYQMILDVFPRVKSTAFKLEYNNIPFSKDQALFQAWCEGKTGVPIVDSAMRCLNETGLMHNRLRMIVATFLTKTMLIDWRMGEAYFALKLLDFDLAANNGGWQWCASTGVDASPYFRIFNPFTQSEKFDPKAKFIRKYCPELKLFSDKIIHTPFDATPMEQMSADCMIGVHYPYPVVHYREQKEKVIALFQAAKLET